MNITIPAQIGKPKPWSKDNPRIGTLTIDDGKIFFDGQQMNFLRKLLPVAAKHTIFEIKSIVFSYPDQIDVYLKDSTVHSYYIGLLRKNLDNTVMRHAEVPPEYYNLHRMHTVNRALLQEKLDKLNSEKLDAIWKEMTASHTYHNLVYTQIGNKNIFSQRARSVVLHRVYDKSLYIGFALVLMAIVLIALAAR